MPCLWWVWWTMGGARKQEMWTSAMQETYRGRICGCPPPFVPFSLPRNTAASLSSKPGWEMLMLQGSLGNLGGSGDPEVLMIPTYLRSGWCPAAVATAQEDTAVFKRLRSLQNSKVLLSQCYKWLNHEAKYKKSNEACGCARVWTRYSKELRRFCHNLYK